MGAAQRPAEHFAHVAVEPRADAQPDELRVVGFRDVDAEINKLNNVADIKAYLKKQMHVLAQDVAALLGIAGGIPFPPAELLHLLS